VAVAEQQAQMQFLFCLVEMVARALLLSARQPHLRQQLVHQP
jgi:hypothetical protein